MSILVSTITTNAQALLNDVNKETYTDAALVTLLQICYADFLLGMDENDVPSLDEISTPILVTAGTTTLAPLPSDFKTPLQLKERLAGSSDTFNEMFQKNWEPDRTPTQTLLYWTYREDVIRFLPATTDREVKLFYVKDLTISGLNSVIPVVYADVVLQYKLAARAAVSIGENYTRGQALDALATEAEQKFLNRRVKGRQSQPMRRPGFRERRKNNYQFR